MNQYKNIKLPPVYQGDLIRRLYIYVALHSPVWSKSLYLGKNDYLVKCFYPTTLTHHPALVFRPAHNEFSDNVPPYTCIPVYDFKYFQVLSSRLFEFEDL